MICEVLSLLHSKTMDPFLRIKKNW